VKILFYFILLFKYYFNNILTSACLLFKYVGGPDYHYSLKGIKVEKVLAYGRRVDIDNSHYLCMWRHPDLLSVPANGGTKLGEEV
jgi:hypothetical protein